MAKDTARAAQDRANDGKGVILPGARKGDFLHPGVPDNWELQFYSSIFVLLCVCAAMFLFLGHVPWIKTGAVAFGVLCLGLVLSVQWFLREVERAEREASKRS